MSKNIEVLLRAKETTELLGPKNIFQESPEPRRPATRVPPVGTKEEANWSSGCFFCQLTKRHACGFPPVGQMDEAVGICARAGQNLASQTDASVCVVDGDLHSPPCMNASAWTTCGDLRMLSSNPDPSKISSPSFGQQPLGTHRWLRRGEAQAPWKSERLRSRMTELRAEFSYVLVNGPPVGQHLDALLLGRSRRSHSNLGVTPYTPRDGAGG